VACHVDVPIFLAPRRRTVLYQFLTTVFSFPTVVFAGLLALVLLYWCIVIFGALDLDFLDSVLGLDDLDSALDSAVESLDGAAEGAADFDASEIGEIGDAADGADADVDGDGSSKDGALAGILNMMGVRGVPLTIVGSAVVLWAFVLSFLGTELLGPLAASVLVGSVLGLTVFAGGLVFGAVTVRPFKKIFVTPAAVRRDMLVGKLCTVTSARVDHQFGRAEIHDGGAGFLAEVRCPQPNDLSRGSKALVFRYDASEGIFFIGPVDEVLTSDAAIQGDT
jgi:hypothetical protein